MTQPWSVRCPRCDVLNEGAPLKCENCGSADVRLGVHGPDLTVDCIACAESKPIHPICEKCGARLEALIARGLRIAEPTPPRPWWEDEANEGCMTLIMAVVIIVVVCALTVWYLSGAVAD